MICDREAEIDAFIPEEYWSIDGIFDVKGEKKPLTAHFYGDEKGKIEIKTAAQAEEIRSFCEKAYYSVKEVKKGERIKKAPLPFTTSTLQQEASKALNFSTSKTMRIAQNLYATWDKTGHEQLGTERSWNTVAFRGPCWVDPNGDIQG